MNKEKKIMIVLLSAFILGACTGGYLGQQKVNRMNTFVEVIDNGAAYKLNAEEYKDYKEGKYVLSQPVSELVIEDESEGDESNLVYLGEFQLTGYCDCPICQEEWVGTTALGVAPQENWTIAVDPDVIPLGSYVYINGTKYCAEDVGGMINDNHIDIFCGSHEECYSDFCNGYADVYLEVNE